MKNEKIQAKNKVCAVNDSACAWRPICWTVILNLKAKIEKNIVNMLLGPK